MTARIGRIGATAGATMLVLAMAGINASAQNTNGTPGPFSGGGRGRGLGRQGGPGASGIGGPMQGLLAPRFAEELALSETQKDTLKSIAQSHAEEWKTLMDREGTARQAVGAAVDADPFDEAAIRQRIMALSAVEADVAVARARAHAELLQVLTADQRTKLKSLASERPERRGRRG